MLKRSMFILAIWIVVFLFWPLTTFAQAPTIISTSPTQNELNVAVSTNISVTFDIEMDETTINDSTFVVHARSTGLHQGTISYDSGTRTATLDPTDDFDVGEVVTVVLTTGIQSAGGIPLGSSHLWSFTTVVEGGTACFTLDSAYSTGGDQPRSVFAADLNGDGHLDLAVANCESGDISVLFNNGDGTFVFDAAYATWYNRCPCFISGGDFDGDGDIDLAAPWRDCPFNYSVFFYFLNNGDGTFAPCMHLNCGHSSGQTSIAPADLDGDGDLDLAIAEYHKGNVGIAFNNGSGSFYLCNAFSSGDLTHDVSPADLDGDGDFDVAAANLGSDDVRILLNDGSGSFASGGLYTVGDGPWSEFAADLDGDGDNDLAVANSASDNISILLNQGDGIFAPDTVYPTGDNPHRIFAADLDGDGDLDLATSNYGSDSVSVLFNQGDGTFASRVDFSADDPYSLFVADLDGDGDLDLVTANYSSDNVSVLLNEKPTPHIVSTSPIQNELNVPVNTNISVTFDTDMGETTINDSTFVVHARSTGLHQGMISYDNGTRTATLDPTEDFDVGEVITVVLTTGIQSFCGMPLDSAYAWSFTTVVDGGGACFTLDSAYSTGGDQPRSVFAADLNGDGHLDLAVANCESGDISVLFNNGDGTFVFDAAYATWYNQCPCFISGGDFDGDGDIDLVAPWRDYFGTAGFFYFSNIGDGTFGPCVLFECINGTGRTSIAPADFDGDGYLDLALAEYHEGRVGITFSDGSGSFYNYSVFPSGNLTHSVSPVDLDGDGDFDVAAANLGSDDVRILLNDGSGDFVSGGLYNVGGGPWSEFAADLDGDGDNDLAVANHTSNNVSILLNQGDGTFAPDTVYPTGDNPHTVFAADLDGDGDLDLATSNYGSDSVSVLLNEGNGTFASRVDFPAGDDPYSLFAADLDGDGDVDLVTANYSSDNVSVLLNQPAVVICGDANNDGVVELGDIVYLINYVFKQPAPAPEPYECVGDVNHDGVVELGDIVYLINYVFKQPAPPPDPCCCAPPWVTE